MSEMNIFLKGCLIAGVAMVAVGAAITAFDYTRTLREARQPTAAKETLQEPEQMQGGVFEISGTLQKLDIELSGGRLQLLQGEEASLQIGKKLQPYMRCEQQEDTLILRDTLNEKWWKSFHDWGDTGYMVTLVLPKEGYESVHVSLGVGEGNLQGLTADKLTVYSGAAEMCLQEISAGDLEISSGAGEVSAYGIYTTRSADIGCGVGEFSLAGDLRGKVFISGGIGEMSLQLAGAQEDYSISANSGIGQVSVGGETVSMFTGGIKQERENAENRLDISCGVGEIDIRFSEDINKSF
ncbi:MAG: DUF4097 domain-containing protein [Provencibacterium sp.]|nr:DUF4097 domain-containing protein [Provencibacterium sp.]